MEKKSIGELRAELQQVEAEIKRIVDKEPGSYTSNSQVKRMWEELTN